MSHQVTTTDLPAAVLLRPILDAEGMRRELERLDGTTWRPEEPYRMEGFFGSETKVYHDGKWAGLAIRSQGGRVDRTDPGGPSLEPMAYTALAEAAPCIAAVVKSLDTPIRTARLLRLPPGGVIGEHRDTYHGLEYGQLRLHAPITTNDAVKNVIRGTFCRWRPGELWYGDFGSLHSGRNDGATDRVHLVIDALITPRLLQLFPDDLQSSLADVDTLFHEEPLLLSDGDLKSLECRFAIPSTLVRGIFDIDDGIQAQLTARVVLRDGRLLLNVEDRDLFGLVPLSDRRLMFLGWTLERYLQYEAGARGVTAMGLVLRRGSEETRIPLHLQR